MFETSWTSFCVCFITGSPGAGKSYCLTRDLHARLAEHRGPIITNLPLDEEAFSKSAAEKHGRTVEEIKNQLHLIPRNILASWKAGDTLPAELVHSPQIVGLDDIHGALFVLDECHLFCPRRNKARQAAWESWLGEVRHEGWAGIYFVSQAQEKVGDAIKTHAELQYELTKADKLKDPFFGIELGMWWEVLASWTNQYMPAITLTLYRRKKGKLAEEDSRRVRLDSWYFNLYHSYQAAGGGSDEAVKEVPQQEYQKRPRLWFVEGDGEEYIAPTWLWFLSRTWPRLLGRFAIVGVFVWVCFLGGGVYMVNKWIETTGKMASANTVDPVVGSDEPWNDDGVRKPLTPEQEKILDEKFAVPLDAGDTVLSVAGAREVVQVLNDLPVEKRQIVQEHLAAIEHKYQEERDTIRDTERSEYERKQKERRQLRITAIDRTRVWLNDGTEVFDGELIIGGLLDGLRAVEIDRGKRRVKFDDGLTLGMGRPNGVFSDKDDDTDGESDKESKAGGTSNSETGFSRAVSSRPASGNANSYPGTITYGDD